MWCRGWGCCPSSAGVCFWYQHYPGGSSSVVGGWWWFAAAGVSAVCLYTIVVFLTAGRAAHEYTCMRMHDAASKIVRRQCTQLNPMPPCCVLLTGCQPLAALSCVTRAAVVVGVPPAQHTPTRATLIRCNIPPDLAQRTQADRVQPLASGASHTWPACLSGTPAYGDRHHVARTGTCLSMRQHNTFDTLNTSRSGHRSSPRHHTHTTVHSA
jgi:hypothetical protein